MEFLKKFFWKFKDRNNTQAVYNINYNGLCKQKRLAFVYRDIIFSNQINFKNLNHVNILHEFQMLNVFIEQNYIIDLYSCSQYTPQILKKDSYDIIIGFGHNYSDLCVLNPLALKILFVTENAPWIVKQKFSERLEYYKQRHNNIPYTISRTQFYNQHMFEISDIGIIMNGYHNYMGMKDYFNKSYQINVNALFNPQINNIPQKSFHNIKKNFVWFGSNGLIHKGLDILIESFAQLPDYTLNIYGAPTKEIKQFTIPKNVKIHSNINVYSEQFINDVIKENTYVISLSCSEGMMSGVATCMVHGLIPITSIETGFDNFPHNIPLKSYKISDVVETLKSITKIDEITLQQLSHKTYMYSKREYSLEYFTHRFKTIMNDINQNFLS